MEIQSLGKFLEKFCYKWGANEKLQEKWVQEKLFLKWLKNQMPVCMERIQERMNNCWRWRKEMGNMAEAMSLHRQQG